MLKSMLYNNLNNTMHPTDYCQLIGFETTPTDYQIDYQLHNGIGTLDQDVNLACLF